MVVGCAAARTWCRFAGFRGWVVVSELVLCAHSRIGIGGGHNVILELAGWGSCCGCGCRVVWRMVVWGGLIRSARCLMEFFCE